ncbi:hypothetical protein [Nostoc sp. FACHB-190]|uniref:hypothetical protein n=1 Tax=Nostoc sp. FACHB-190 TaxID=2692838 RepID=UPI001687CA74|nr:hypothetical protein [Nostoc sp. FACHB-190]MBD2299100.1 hypothetical protein [Nostoc sp. FACHB-190]
METNRQERQGRKGKKEEKDRTYAQATENRRRASGFPQGTTEAQSSRRNESLRDILRKS